MWLNITPRLEHSTTQLNESPATAPLTGRFFTWKVNSQEEAMTRQNMIVVVLGGLAIAAASLPAAEAQTATSTAHNMCVSYGLVPGTLDYGQCVANQAEPKVRNVTVQTYQIRPAIAYPTPTYRTVPYAVDGSVQTYRIRPLPANPLYYEEYVVTHQVATW
jgi:hypothetical protein